MEHLTRIAELRPGDVFSDADRLAVAEVLAGLKAVSAALLPGDALPLRPLGQRREHLARILHNANTGRITPDSRDPTLYQAMADAVIKEWSAEISVYEGTGDDA